MASPDVFKQLIEQVAVGRTVLAGDTVPEVVVWVAQIGSSGSIGSSIVIFSHASGSVTMSRFLPLLLCCLISFTYEQVYDAVLTHQMCRTNDHKVRLIILQILFNLFHHQEVTFVVDNT